MLTKGRAVWGLWSGGAYLLEPGSGKIAIFDDKAVAQVHANQMIDSNTSTYEVKRISRGTGIIRGLLRC